MIDALETSMTDTTSTPLEFAGAATAPSPAPRRRAPGESGLGWLLPLALLLTWQGASSLGAIANAIMPSPLAVLAAAWRLTLTGELPQSVWVSFLRDGSGKVTGFTGYQDGNFEARKLDK